MAETRKTLTEDVRVKLPLNLKGAADVFKETLGLVEGMYKRQLSKELTLSLEKRLWNEVAENLKKGAAGLTGAARS
ncbi:MAG: hypothetical protein ACREN0_07055, partial [Thermodesulfobacteriota bacterium]